MRSIFVIFLGLCGALTLSAHAQISTNTPATEIENFELMPDVVIVKGLGEIGSVSTDDGVVSVRCKESDNATSGRRLYGISVALESNDSRGFLVVDYDELDAMLHGLDFLSKISYDSSPMPSFDATFTTRSGLRVGAHTERRQTGIELFLQFGDTERIALSGDQFTQFQNLINNAKTSLDAARNKNSSSP